LAVPALSASIAQTVSLSATQWLIASNPSGIASDPWKLSYTSEAYPILAIYPNAQAAPSATQQVLDLHYDFLYSASTEESIVYVFSSTGLNFSQMSTLEITMLGDASNNQINFHLGGISEDVDNTGGMICQDGSGRRVPKSKDANCNGILSPAEDAAGWTYIYSGDLGNKQIGQSDGQFDSEDLNHNGVVDAQDSTGGDFGYANPNAQNTNLWFDETLNSTHTTPTIDFGGNVWHTFQIPLNILTQSNWTAIKELRISIRQAPGGGSASSGTLKFARIAMLGNAVSTIGSGGGTIMFSPEGNVASNGPYAPTTINIPPQAFSSPVNITIQAPSSFPLPTAPAVSLTGTNIGVQITLDQPVQPAVNATITLSYLPSDVTGLDANNLILARYDTTQNVWVPLVSSVNTTNRTITAQTNHFSIFQIMQANPSATVSTAKAFPNPLRPAQGQSLMTFSMLPANARIRIYNVKGSIVKDMTADQTGMANWDGTNQSGAPAASGVYFVFAQGTGESRTLKVAIQR